MHFQPFSADDFQVIQVEDVAPQATGRIAASDPPLPLPMDHNMTSLRGLRFVGSNSLDAEAVREELLQSSNAMAEKEEKTLCAANRSLHEPPRTDPLGAYHLDDVLARSRQEFSPHVSASTRLMCEGALLTIAAAYRRSS